MARFFVVGDATVDQMYFVEALPESGGEVTARRSLMQPGGAGGTVAAALAWLGNDVRIATRVGQGPFAELALTNLVSAGVDLSLLQRDTERQTSSVTLLVTPDTQRTMISAIGASRYLDAAQLQPEHVAAADAVVMSAYSLVAGPQREYAVKTLEYARQADVTTFMDMGSGAIAALRDRLVDLIRDIDYLLMNEHELYRLTGENSISAAVAWLRDIGVDKVVVKVGEMGSIVITPELTELVDAFDVDDVLDSTGAGDYYTAAFAHGIMQGYDMLHAARIGNVAGGLNTTEIGAQGYVLDRAQVDAWAEEMEAVGS